MLSDSDAQTLAELLTELNERVAAMQAVEELAQIGSWTWDAGAQAMSWSDQLHHIFGTDPGATSPDHRRYIELLHPDDRDRVLEELSTGMASGTSYEVEHRIVRPDGQVVDLRARGRVELDADGSPTRMTGSVQDVTAAKIAERELQQSRDLFGGVLDAATEQSIIAMDPQGLITVFNTGAERMLGYKASEMIGTSADRLHDPNEIVARAAELGVEPGIGVFLALATSGEPDTRQWTYVTRDGHRVLASITVTAMYGRTGALTGYINIGTDVTELHLAQMALRDSEQRFRDTFDHAPNGMMLVDVSRADRGRILQVNPALCDLTGFTRDQLLELNVADLTAPEDLVAHTERFEALSEGREVALSVERHWLHADGRDLWVQFNVSPRTPSGDPFVVGQVDDITARRQAEARLTHLALHDGLTGLPNRMLLMDRIAHALAANARSTSHVGVFYVDLDGFKAVNDTAGHAAGDHTLVQVGGRISQALRPGDTVARLGGDEFVVVCEGLDDEAAATEIAKRILGAVRGQYEFGAHTFGLSASIGASLSAEGSEPDRMLLEADQAMYRAKHAGKSRIRIGGADDPSSIARSARAQRAIRIEGELSTAVDKGELILYGQPVLNMLTNRVVAVENLLRWQHPSRGLVGPADFLDVAEASELMIPIGRRALDESCRMAASWADISNAPPDVHVNISGRQLESGNLLSDVVEALDRYGLSPSRLVLELTETHMPLLADSMRKDLLSMRDRGVKVALDDLGTGFSSLSRITGLPVDILKIDVSFVARMETDPTCAAVVRGILAIGDALGLTVIAEGVETLNQAELLLSYGCDTVQGYLYSRPLPERALSEHLSNANA